MLKWNHTYTHTSSHDQYFTSVSDISIVQRSYHADSLLLTELIEVLVPSVCNCCTCSTWDSHGLLRGGSCWGRDPSILVLCQNNAAPGQWDEDGKERYGTRREHHPLKFGGPVACVAPTTGCLSLLYATLGVHFSPLSKQLCIVHHYIGLLKSRRPKSDRRVTVFNCF